MSSQDLARARVTGTAAWVWLAVGGGVSLVLGLVCLFATDATLTVLGIVLSLWLMVAGLARVALAASMKRWSTGRRVLQGVLGVVLAAAGLAGLLGLWSALTLVTVVVGVGFLISAAADFGMAMTGPRGVGRFATGALGLLNLGIGLLFLLLPDVGLALLAVLVGITLIVLGGVQLMAAGVVRALVHRVDAVSRDLGARPAPGDDPRVIRGDVL